MITTTKNRIPPHAERANAKNKLERINFINQNFPLLNLIPDTKR